MAESWPCRPRGGNARALISALPYIAVYRVKEESIEVLRIYHAAEGQ